MFLFTLAKPTWSNHLGFSPWTYIAMVPLLRLWLPGVFAILQACSLMWFLDLRLSRPFNLHPWSFTGLSSVKTGELMLALRKDPEFQVIKYLIKF